jgi:hypothetical protein
VTLSITYDEAATYLWSIPYRFKDIMQFNTSGVPDNNHSLYTILAKISLRWFGDSHASFRLPSTISYVVYCCSIISILNRWFGKQSFILFAIFVLFISLNSELVDMMSLARGYGMGIALAMLGLTAMLRTYSSPRRVFWTWVAAFSFGLATLAHLSLALFAAVASGIILAEILLDLVTKRIAWGAATAAAAAPVVINCAVAPLLFHQIQVLRPWGLLGTEGLISFNFDTVQMTVFISLLHGVPSDVWLNIICAFVYLTPVLAIFTLAASLRWVTISWSDRRDLAILIAMLLGVSVASVVQHYVFDVAYLTGRRAIALFPLFALCCAATTAMLLDAKRKAYTVLASILVVGVLFATVQFARDIQFGKTNDWVFDADVPIMIDDLTAMARCAGDRDLKLGITWVFDTAINYYVRRDHNPAIALVDQSDHRPLAERLGPDDAQHHYDVYYVLDREADRLQELRGPQMVLRHYDRSATTLTAPAGSPLIPCR